MSIQGCIYYLEILNCDVVLEIVFFVASIIEPKLYEKIKNHISKIGFRPNKLAKHFATILETDEDSLKKFFHEREVQDQTKLFLSKKPIDEDLLFTTFCNITGNNFTKIKFKSLWDEVEDFVMTKITSEERETIIHAAIRRMENMIITISEQDNTRLSNAVNLYCTNLIDDENFVPLHDAGGNHPEKSPTIKNVFIDLDIKPEYPFIPSDDENSEPETSFVRNLKSHDPVVKNPVLVKNESGETNEEDETKITDFDFASWYVETPKRRKKSLSVLDYLIDEEIMNLVLVGGPGQGKTTLCQYISQNYRLLFLGKLDEVDNKFVNCDVRIPFRVILREYATWVNSTTSENTTLFHYLATQMNISGNALSPDDIKTISRLHPILLILDGLDEISIENRDKIIKKISLFIEYLRDEYESDIRVIVTTRPFGYSNEFPIRKYLHLTLQSLTKEKTLEYTEKLLQIQNCTLQEKDDINSVFQDCIDDPIISEITRTPLQVTIVIIIIYQNGNPPKQREELFNEYMKIIYERERKKGLGLLKTDKDIIYGLHEYVAYVIQRNMDHEKNQDYLIDEEFKQKIKEYLVFYEHVPKDQDPDELVEGVIKEAGQRLVLIENSHENKWGFSIPNIREFFTAAYLFDYATGEQNRSKRFEIIATREKWNQVAQFFAGRMGRNLRGEVASLVNICREIDRKNPDIFLKRGAELVTQILTDHALRNRPDKRTAIEYIVDAVTSGNQFGTDISEYSFLDLKKIAENFLVDDMNILKECLLDKIQNSTIAKSYVLSQMYLILYEYDNELRASINNSPFSLQLKLDLFVYAINNKIDKNSILNMLNDVAEKSSPFDFEKRELEWPYIGNYDLSILSKKSISLIAEISLRGFTGDRYNAAVWLDEKNQVNSIESLIFFGCCMYNMINEPSNIGFSDEIENTTNHVTVSMNCFLADPDYRSVIKNENEIEILQKMISNESPEDDPIIKLLYKIFEVVLDPSNKKSYLEVSKLVENKSIKGITTVFGRSITQLTTAIDSFESLMYIRENYKTKDDFRMPLLELEKIVNSKTDTYPYKVKLIDYILAPHSRRLSITIEPELKFLIDDFIGKNKYLIDFLIYKGFKTDDNLIDNVLMNYLLDVAEEFIKSGSMDNMVVDREWFFSYFFWDYHDNDEGKAISARLKTTIVDLLNSTKTFTRPVQNILLQMYVSGLSAGIINTNLMEQIYGKIKNSTALTFPKTFSNNMYDFLNDVVVGDNNDAAWLATLTLSRKPNLEMSKAITKEEQNSRYWEKLESKLFNASRGTENIFPEELFDNTEDVVYALPQAINTFVENSEYVNDDQIHFIKFLEKILNLKEKSFEDIRKIAYSKLKKISYQKSQFVEDDLLLPFPPNKEHH